MPSPDLHPLPGREVVLGPTSPVDGSARSEALRLHVVEHGRAGTALPLLMLHGVPATSYLWRDVARDLEHDRLCLMPDLVGCGESERPPGRQSYRLDAQAGVLLELLGRLGIDRFAVLGTDLGGAVAVQVAALSRTTATGPRAEALLLSGAPVHALAWPSPPAVPLLLPGVGEALLGAMRSRPSVARRVVASALGARLSDRELDRYLAALGTRDDAAALLRLVRGVDLGPVERSWEELRKAPLPTLVLWGEQDRLRSPAYGRRLAAEMPGAVWVPVADAGHLLPAERPERVAEEVAGFLAELPVG
jgi:pimeloyl-ACP methyl ester carboxylesterase